MTTWTPKINPGNWVKRTKQSYPARSTCKTTALRPNVMSSMRVCKCSKSPSNSAVYQSNTYAITLRMQCMTLTRQYAFQPRSLISLSNLFVCRISWQGLYSSRLVLSHTPGHSNHSDKQRLQRRYLTRDVMQSSVRSCHYSTL